MPWLEIQNLASSVFRCAHSVLASIIHIKNVQNQELLPWEDTGLNQWSESQELPNRQAAIHSLGWKETAQNFSSRQNSL